MSAPSGKRPSNPVPQAISLAVYDDDPTALLRLSGAEAQVALDEMSKLLDLPSLPGSGKRNIQSPSSRNNMRKLCLKLCLSQDIYPSSLVLIGVKCKDRDSAGGGGFADVYRGEYYEAPVALKRLRAYLMSTDTQKAKLRQAFYRECLLWKHLRHEYILPFLGISEDAFDHSFCMVSPWMENGSIRNYVDSLRQQGKLPADRFAESVNKWLHQTALGMSYLHEEGIVHGDLHGGNILIDTSGNARLTDFGMALISEASPYKYASVHGGGACRWLAPELIDPEAFGLNSTRPTTASDIYSFACTCIEVYTGESPFSGLTEHQVMLRVVQGTRPERPSVSGQGTISDRMWSLVISCWAQVARERPSSHQVTQKFGDILSTPIGTQPLPEPPRLQPDPALPRRYERATEEISSDRPLPTPPSTTPSRDGVVAYNSKARESAYIHAYQIPDRGATPIPSMEPSLEPRQQVGPVMSRQIPSYRPPPIPTVRPEVSQQPGVIRPPGQQYISADQMILDRSTISTPRQYERAAQGISSDRPFPTPPLLDPVIESPVSQQYIRAGQTIPDYGATLVPPMPPRQEVTQQVGPAMPRQHGRAAPWIPPPTPAVRSEVKQQPVARPPIQQYRNDYQTVPNHDTIFIPPMPPRPEAERWPGLAEPPRHERTTPWTPSLPLSPALAMWPDPEATQREPAELQQNIRVNQVIPGRSTISTPPMQPSTEVNARPKWQSWGKKLFRSRESKVQIRSDDEIIEDLINQALKESRKRGESYTLPHIKEDQVQLVINKIFGLLIDPNTIGDRREELLRLCMKMVRQFSTLPAAMLLTDVRYLTEEKYTLGQGTFAYVYWGRRGDTDVAVKPLRYYPGMGKFERKDHMAALYRELLLWKLLDHPNILPLHGICHESADWQSENLLVVSKPVARRGNIRDHAWAYRMSFQPTKPGFTFIRTVSKWLYQVALALAYAHQCGTVHGNLHCGNILIDLEENAQLTDFRLAFIVGEKSYGYSSTHGGTPTPSIRPPELDPESANKNDNRQTPKCDVFSFAFICFELYTGKVAFSNEHGGQIGSIIRGRRPPRPNALCSASDPSLNMIWDLMTRCWSQNPQERPSSQEVAERMKIIYGSEIEY